MEQVLEWVSHGILTALVGAFVALFGRVRKLETTQARIEERLADVEERDRAELRELAEIKGGVHDLQLTLERNFMRRDEWVPQISMIRGGLEKQGRQLERLEERLAGVPCRTE